MFRKILRFTWRVTKILFVITLFAIWIGQVYVNQQDHTLLNIQLNRLNRQIFLTNDRVNEMLDNEILLAGQLDNGNNISQLLNGKILALGLDFQKMNKEIDKLVEETKTILDKTKYIDIVDANRLLNASVLIVNGFGEGSGTVIKKTDTEMYILTCYHVVEGTDVVSVGYNKTDKTGRIGGMVIFAGEVIKTDIDNDLALVKTFVVDNNLEVVTLAKNEPKRGDTVYTVGNPLGIPRNISKGILSNKIDGFYITDALTTFGNSGGGLFNRDGELIGVPIKVPVYGMTNDYLPVPESSLGHSISLPIIKEFLKDTL